MSFSVLIAAAPGGDAELKDAESASHGDQAAGYLRFNGWAGLQAAYATLIPNEDTPVVVHCPTGHQASRTTFPLKHLLGYRPGVWYDGGWTEWAARPGLPVMRSAGTVPASQSAR